jgi:hypothetical protein
MTGITARAGRESEDQGRFRGSKIPTAGKGGQKWGTLFYKSYLQVNLLTVQEDQKRHGELERATLCAVFMLVLRRGALEAGPVRKLTSP